MNDFISAMVVGFALGAGLVILMEILYFRKSKAKIGEIHRSFQSHIDSRLAEIKTDQANFLSKKINDLNMELDQERCRNGFLEDENIRLKLRLSKLSSPS